MTSNPAVAANLLARVPPVMPKSIRLWFSILEEQMEAADIIDVEVQSPRWLPRASILGADRGRIYAPPSRWMVR